MGDDEQAVVDRLFHSTVAALELLTVALGSRLGLYEVLRDAGPLTADQLAERGGIHPRYAREWLEQQATAELLAVDDAALPADRRTYRLPDAHVAALADPLSLDHVAPLARLVAGMARPFDALVHAYRTGGGVTWDQFGPDAREGQAAVNRPAFLDLLPNEWIAAMPDVAERLSSGPTRVADLGCGAGWACIGIARAFPQARVDGYDLDRASVELARQNVKEARLDDRVAVHRGDASDLHTAGHHDLVTVLEVLHDVTHPVQLLATARRLAGADGVVLVADERVADEFGAIGDDIERMMYGWSVLCCLPSGMAEPDGAATGTVMRRATLQDYAERAGFAGVEVLDVDNDFFRLYRLTG